MSWVYRRPPDYRAGRSVLFALLAAASATSGVAAVAFANTGSVTGSGRLAGTASITIEAQAAPASLANLAGSSAILSDLSGSLLAGGVLAGSSQLAFANSATASGSSGLQIVRYSQKHARWQPEKFDYLHASNRLVIFPLNVPSGISGQADLSFLATTGTLTGTASVSGAAALAFGGAGLLRGSGQISGSAADVFTAAGELSDTGSGVVSGSAALVITPSASLVGAGALVGTIPITFSASLLTGSVQPISGSVDLTLTASASFTVGPPPVRKGSGIRVPRPRRGVRLS